MRAKATRRGSPLRFRSFPNREDPLRGADVFHVKPEAQTFRLPRDGEEGGRMVGQDVQDLVPVGNMPLCDRVSPIRAHTQRPGAWPTPAPRRVGWTPRLPESNDRTALGRQGTRPPAGEMAGCSSASGRRPPRSPPAGRHSSPPPTAPAGWSAHRPLPAPAVDSNLDHLSDNMQPQIHADERGSSAVSPVV